jgi:adenylate cyclase
MNRVKGTMPKTRTIVLLFVIGAGIVVLCLVLFPSGPAASTGNTIAVLPLTEVQGDSPPSEYFADGVTEDLLNMLSKVAAIDVISYQTIIQYKGSVKSIHDIGNELHAGSILRGTFRARETVCASTASSSMFRMEDRCGRKRSTAM